MVASGGLAQGSRLAVYRRRGLEHCAARSGADGFRVRSLPRLVRGSFGPGCLRRLGRRAAEDPEGAGAKVERIADRPSDAGHAAAGLESRDRLAPGALLWRAEQESERAFLWQAEA